MAKTYKTQAEKEVERAKKANRQVPLTPQPTLFPEEAVNRSEEILNQVNNLQGDLMKPAQSYSKVVREQVKRIKDSNTLVAGSKGRKPTKEKPFSQEEQDNIRKRVQNILDNELVVYIDTEFSDYSGKSHTTETAMKAVGVDNPEDAGVKALVRSKTPTWNKDFVQIAGLIHDKGQPVGQFDEWGNISNNEVNRNAEMVTHETLGKINPTMLSQFPEQKEMLTNVSKKLPEQPFYAIGSKVETADILPIMKEMIFNGIQTPTIKGSIDTATLAKALGVYGKGKKDPKKPSYGLQEVSEALGHIPENAHNALDDNKTVRTVLERLLMSPSALVDLLEGQHANESALKDPNLSNLAILEQGVKNAVNRGGVSSNPQSPYYKTPAPSLMPNGDTTTVSSIEVTNGSGGNSTDTSTMDTPAPPLVFNNSKEEVDGVNAFKKVTYDYKTAYYHFVLLFNAEKDISKKITLCQEMITQAEHYITIVEGILSNYKDSLPDYYVWRIKDNIKISKQTINNFHEMIKSFTSSSTVMSPSDGNTTYNPINKPQDPEYLTHGANNNNVNTQVNTKPINNIHPSLGGGGANMPPTIVNTRTDNTQTGNDQFSEPPEFNEHSNDQQNLPPGGTANRDTAIAKWKSIQAEEKTLREAIRLVRKMTDTVSQSDTAKILLQKVNTLIAEAHTAIATIKQGDNQHG